jgi:Tfp pilus assembly protein PilZ
MDEWRKSARVGLVSEVQIQRIVSEAGEVVAWGTDLSEGGIGLLTNSQLQLGEEIALQIAVPGSDAPISVKGLVVWAKAAKPGLRVGVRFREVEALAGAQILQLVTDRLARLSARPAAVTPAAQTEIQPSTTPAIPSVPTARPVRVRRPLVTILLAVVALALFLQNRELTRSVRDLKAQVTALQALGQ